MTESGCIKVATLVGEARQIVGFVEVIESLLLIEQTDGMLDAEGVDIVGKRGTLYPVDSVDNIVLGDAEVVSEKKDREVRVEVGLGVFDIFGQLMAEERQVAPRTRGEASTTHVERLDTDRGAEGEVSDKEHDDRLHEGTDGGTHNRSRGVEGIHDVAEDHKEAIECNKEVGAHQIGSMNTVDGVILVE